MDKQATPGQRIAGQVLGAVVVACVTFILLALSLRLAFWLSP